MKKSLLESLVGLELLEADRQIVKAGFIPWAVPVEVDAITMIARPNTVILWLDKKDEKLVVRSAESGDPTQLTD